MSRLECKKNVLTGYSTWTRGYRKTYYHSSITKAVKLYVKYLSKFATNIAFIDCSKLFDSLLHEKIWKTLLEQGNQHIYI